MSHWIIESLSLNSLFQRIHCRDRPGVAWIGRAFPGWPIFCLGELWNVYAISEKIYVDLIGSNQNVTQSNYSLTIYNKTQLQQKSINGITIHNLDTKHQCLRIWVLSFFMCLITLSLPLLPPIHTVKRVFFFMWWTSMEKIAYSFAARLRDCVFVSECLLNYCKHIFLLVHRK